MHYVYINIIIGQRVVSVMKTNIYITMVMLR
jgi:hypothetical protein